MSTKHDHTGDNCCAPAAGQSNLVETPRYDVFEDAGGFGVSVYLPGVDASNVSVEFADGTLVVRGKRALPDKPASYLRREFGEYGYELKLRVGAHVNAGGIDAGYEAGILTLRLPKAEEAKPRTIQLRKSGN